MVSEPVLYKTVGFVAYVTLNRPHVHNALSPDSIRALDAIWRKYSLDRSVRVAILTGNGESFCSGRDVKLSDWGFGFREGVEGHKPDDEWASRPCERRRINYVVPPDLYKPVIAAIKGVACGGGLELALSCDMRIAAKGSRLGLPEVTLGVISGSGGLFWLPRLVGVGRAMELALTGRIIDAAEALSIGLVNRVVDGDQLMTEAESLAQRIAAQPPLAIQAVKEAMRRTLGSGLHEALYVSENLGRVLALSDDAKEGCRAFEEKRPPIFVGR